MNPSTGTFITMDEYAGNNFEPVSLHKYLYANANPVMFRDPSGYSAEGTLTSQMTAMAVIGVLSAVILPNYSKFVDAIRFFLTEIYDAFAIATDTIVDWAEGLLGVETTSADIAEDVKNKAKDDAEDAAKVLPRRRNDQKKRYFVAVSTPKIGGADVWLSMPLTTEQALGRLSWGSDVYALTAQDAKNLCMPNPVGPERGNKCTNAIHYQTIQRKGHVFFGNDPNLRFK